MQQAPRSPLKRVGGKAAAASRIIKTFPHPSAYDTYVEPCGGAAHVLMAKERYGHKEVYNDLEGGLVNFWKQIQIHADVMQSRLENFWYSRELYYDYYRSLFDGTEMSDLERAIRYFYVLRGTGTGWLRKSPVGWNYHQGATAYYSAVDLFQQVQERIKGVFIDNRDVLATIRRYDSPTTLFYVDPPYIGTEFYYEASKHGFPHADLAALLNQVQGFVALSYYPDPELDEWYPPEKWRRLTWQQHKSSQIVLETRDEDLATELLLCNYPAPVKTLWSEDDA